MKYIADLHVHSRFSRATSKNLTLENLYTAAQLKGITVVATGDFTHPGWFAEISEKLIPAEEGLFKLKDEIEKEYQNRLPLKCRSEVRFILSTEISNIYKKDGKVRKNHNLVFFPDLDKAKNFNLKLEKIGNITSDGRPILGFDARNLLETVLEVSDEGFLIPAHIWTPWFSLLGSKSGFDSVEECFGDLTPYIFALETGLSSDPAMNWRISKLDNFALVSNSDAHSPLKLGREANLFDAELSYNALKSALKTNDPNKFLGTYEFYPEEGKYHFDGHRKCNVRFSPELTKKHNGICPVCGKMLTLGVMYRVNELSDREEIVSVNDNNNRIPFYSVVPLVDILAEVLQKGSETKKVKENYDIILTKLGAEFEVLNHLPIETIRSIDIPLLAEAIYKMRNNQIVILPGYDGEFGTVKFFDEKERSVLLSQKSLFHVISDPILEKESYKIKLKETVSPKNIKHKYNENNLTDEQLEAIDYDGRALMIIAGPGTGKTRTLTHRIAKIIKEKKVLAKQIAALTFTNKAAQEMEDRLKILLGNDNIIPFVGTFHSLCLKILQNATTKEKYNIIDEDYRKVILSDAIKFVKQKNIAISLSQNEILDKIISFKQKILEPEKVSDEIYQTYQNFLSIQNLIDYEDLLLKTILLFENNEDICRQYQEQFKYIFVDEYQDINYAQYKLIKKLVADNNYICVIGDPNQSIYGFRGSDLKYFNDFEKDYLEAKIIRLTHNFRSTQTILEASYQILKQNSKTKIHSNIEGITTINVLESADDRKEAIEIAKLIQQLIGGTGYHNISDKIDPNQLENKSFSDFAVLYRTQEQGHYIAKNFDEIGIPFQLVKKENLFGKRIISEIISFFKILEEIGTYHDFFKIIKLWQPDLKNEILDELKFWGYNNQYSTNSLLLNIDKFFMHKNLECKFLNAFLEIKTAINELPVKQKILYLIENKVFGDYDNDEKIEIVDMLSKYSNISKFLINLNLKTDADCYINKTEKVSLMTMHASKGLEFPIVFIAGCENDFIPFMHIKGKYNDIEEERRLFYVAMTRAKERLYLTYAKKRKIYGNLIDREISYFISEIQESILKHSQHREKKYKIKPNQLKLF